MALNTDSALCVPVTVWHFLAEGAAGDAVYHAALYEAAVWKRTQADETHPARREKRELGGFLFPPSDGGDGVPVTPTPVRDCIAEGDGTAYETPRQAAEAGYTVYAVDEAERPPRLSGGGMVDWVRFTASAIQM